eukprot:g1792.t1
MLLAAGASTRAYMVDVGDDQRRRVDPPVFYAAAEANFKCVRTLLDVPGTSANMRSVDGRTLLGFAVTSGGVETVKTVLRAGADVDTKGGPWGTSAEILLAAERGFCEIVRLLLDAGANVDTMIKTTHHTALYVASQNNHISTVRLLIERGANLDIASRSGATPLFIAAQKGHEEICRRLIAAGACVNVSRSTAFNDSPLTIASYFGHERVMGMLMAHGADQLHSVHEKSVAMIFNEQHPNRCDFPRPEPMLAIDPRYFNYFSTFERRCILALLSVVDRRENNYMIPFFVSVRIASYVPFGWFDPKAKRGRFKKSLISSSLGMPKVALTCAIRFASSLASMPLQRTSASAAVAA